MQKIICVKVIKYNRAGHMSARLFICTTAGGKPSTVWYSMRWRITREAKPIVSARHRMLYLAVDAFHASFIALRPYIPIVKGNIISK